MRNHSFGLIMPLHFLLRLLIVFGILGSAQDFQLQAHTIYIDGILGSTSSMNFVSSCPEGSQSATIGFVDYGINCEVINGVEYDTNNNLGITVSDADDLYGTCSSFFRISQWGAAEGSMTINFKVGSTIAHSISVTVSFDPNACGSGSCPTGTSVSSVSSIKTTFDLGKRAFGKSAGTLLFREELPAAALSTPQALRF
jgi:hypothetical protein